MIKAIETVYKGYKFRSRLEARWAVFLDALGIKWEYEKEGFDLNGVWYLPDFWLPDYEYWLEIKGQKPAPWEEAKAYLLCLYSKQTVYIIWGDCWFPKEDQEQAESFYLFLLNDDDQPTIDDVMLSFGEKWNVCTSCGDVGLIRDNAGTCECYCRYHDNPRNDGQARLLAAYTAARQARFEVN